MMEAFPGAEIVGVRQLEADTAALAAEDEAAPED